jgi:hypothetical protein
LGLLFLRRIVNIYGTSSQLLVMRMQNEEFL